VWGNATAVVFTGTDNVSASVSLSDIRGDTSSIIAIDAPPHDSLRNVLPSQSSPGSWIFDLYWMRVQ
jgi:hypothetical protein